MRICSFFPTATEILYALGAGTHVVGRSSDCAYPPEVTKKPIVVQAKIPALVPHDSLEIHRAVLRLKSQAAHQFDIHIKRLKQLKPDVLITQNLCAVCATPHPEVAEAAQELASPPRIISLQGQTMTEIFSDIRKVGALIGRSETAKKLIGQLKNRITHVHKKVRGLPRPRVWCCEWLEPLMAAGHWVPEIVTLAGGTDGLSVKGEKSRWISWEEVLRYDPEIICVMPCSYSISQTKKEKRRLTERSGWKNLSAVKNNRVFCIESGIVHHAGPRLVEAVELFAHLFHSAEVPIKRSPGSLKSKIMHLTAPPPLFKNSETSTGHGITPRSRICS